MDGGIGAPRHLPPSIHSQLWKFPANPARVGVSRSLGEGVGLGTEPYVQAKRKGGRGARTPKHNTFSRSQFRRVSSSADGPTPLEPPEARPARGQSTGRGAPPAAGPCPPATGHRARTCPPVSRPDPVLLPPGRTLSSCHRAGPCPPATGPDPVLLPPGRTLSSCHRAGPCPPATGPAPALLPPGPPAECSGPLRLQGRAASPARPASTATRAGKAGRPPRRKSPQPTDPGRPPPRRPRGRVVWGDVQGAAKGGR
jgi:hypothetical protein